MNSAIIVGDYIIAKGRGSFTPMQVLKLAYIGHGYTLALTDKPLFHDRVEAWKYGPVIPNLYYVLREFGESPIPHLYTSKTNVSSPELEARKNELAGLLGDENRGIMDDVLSGYGECSGFELSDITHEAGSPWDDCYVPGELYTKIPNVIIKEYYKNKIEEV